MGIPGVDRSAVPARLASPWQFLMRYLSPQAHIAVPMAVLLLAGTILRVIAPRMLRWFIDQASAGVPMIMLYHIAMLYIAVSLISQALRAMASYWSEQVAWAATNALRLDLTAHLLSLGIGFHKQKTPGELIERVDGDISALAGFLSRFAVELLGSGLLLIGILVSLWMEGVLLGFVFTLFALAATLLLGWVRRFAGAAIRETRERSAGFYGYLSEILAATEDIRALGAVQFVRERLFGHLRPWLPVAVRAEVAGNFIWTAAICVFALGDALAYGLTGLLHTLNAMPVGTIYMVLAYAALLAEPLETIRAQFQDLQRADAGIVRIRQLFQARSPVINGRERLSDGPLAVRFRNVSFSYDEPPSRILSDISFELPPGRRLGILGRTGSGKTTLARLLLRLYDPQGGEISVGGLPLAKADISSLRARVGLVTQEVQLFSASLRDNLTFFDASVPDALLTDILTSLGLGPLLGRLPSGLDTPIMAGSLSAGEAQLLAFARIFLQDPGLVILDEASSRLDPATEELLSAAIERLLAGRTAIIIAHRLATVETVDDLLILDEGRITEYGTRAKLSADAGSRFSALRQGGLMEVLH